MHEKSEFSKNLYSMCCIVLLPEQLSFYEFAIFCLDRKLSWPELLPFYSNSMYMKRLEGEGEGEVTQERRSNIVVTQK